MTKMTMMKYKATERYTLGWADPRVIQHRVHISIGDYTFCQLSTLGNDPHPTKVEIMYRPRDESPTFSMYADQTEFAAYIEAFLKEQHERNNSGL